MATSLVPQIQRFESLDSTNLTAKEMVARGAPEGTVILAASQIAGKGRGQRTWHSPKGGLYFSAIFYPKDPKKVTDLSILAGTALMQAIKEMLPKSADISLKWPNDLLFNWKKVAGVLCEAIGVRGYNAVVVGVGVNVNIAANELHAFQQNPFPATSIQEEMQGSGLDMEEILNMILKKLFALYGLYQEQGFQPIHYLWERNCKMIGKKIELRETGWREAKAHTQAREGGSEVGVTVGTMLGIDESGALVLANARGERRQYVTGEITCFWP
jgi:BirA family transcriptional regulator, biotin operon repressor / biotin---[acetyl-CoA-carboxylase] ligase